MMIRDILFAIEQEAEEMKILKCYLALSPEHTASYNFGSHLRHELSYNVKKGFCLQSYLDDEAFFDEPKPHKLFDDELKGAIGYAKIAEPSPEYKDTFANKWDEIQKVTELNMGANRIAEAGI
jgi:hypothetical protein